jgi:hypothetical protein
MLTMTAEHHRLIKMFEPLETRAFENRATLVVKPLRTGISMILVTAAHDEKHLVRASVGFDITRQQAIDLTLLISECLRKSVERQFQRVFRMPTREEWAGECDGM